MRLLGIVGVVCAAAWFHATSAPAKRDALPEHRVGSRALDLGNGFRTTHGRITRGEVGPEAESPSPRADTIIITPTNAARASTDQPISPAWDYEGSCVLRSSGHAVRYLMVANEAGLEVELNGARLFHSNKTRPFRRWHNAVPLTLKRGRNLLVVRAKALPERPAHLGLMLVPNRRFAGMEALANGGLALSDSMVDSGEMLTVRVRGAPRDSGITVEVCDAQGRTVQRHSDVSSAPVAIVATGPDMPAGIYFVHATLAETRQTKAFVLGDTDRVVDRIPAWALDRSLPPQARDDLGALAKRVTILRTAENRNERNREWRDKLVHAVAEATRIVAPPRQQAGGYRKESGLHLRAFRSVIDGNVQHYRIYLPHREPSRPPALIVMLPTPVVSARPFLESPFVARHHEAETIATIAEQLGCVLLWPGYRSKPAGLPCELTHLDEVLADVQRDHGIDRARVYLVTSCAGTAFAFEAAMRSPQRFAGIGLLNPSFRVPMLRLRNEAVYETAAFRAWRDASNPISRFLHAAAAPVTIVHDGVAEPGHGELEESLSFVAEAKETPLQPRFISMTASRDVHYHMDGWRTLFNVLLTGRRPVGLPDPAPHRWPRGGSIRDAFAAPFRVVYGTAGNAAEQERMREIAAAFKEQWRELHYSDCPVLADHQVAAGDTSTNLVLIGNAATNRLWSSLGVPSAPNLPVALHERTDTSYQWVLSHPHAPGKRLVLLGATDVAAMQFGTLELSHAGWFDYALWQNGSPPALVEAGLYQPPSD